MSAFNNMAAEHAQKVSARFSTTNADAGPPYSLEELQLTILIFVFGLISTAVFYFLVRSKQATPFLMRIYVVIILIFGSLLVVSGGFGTDQIAPVIGFFGTIAGYLLGRSDRPADKHGMNGICSRRGR